jgi:phosphopantothenoylcysteine decarboxylase/phosphopantothenate--cysteine ligase
MELSNRHIVLGLTGGIACYKAAALCRELMRAGATVQVVMTDAAQEFISVTTMQALSGRPVATSQWDGSEPNAMPHINLTRNADAILVAPCTANFIGKLAQGIADDLLSTLCVARTCPLLVAPAMNVEMWTNTAVQRNVAQLHSDGITVLGPGEGDQACGETGLGRMLEPEQLLAELIAFFAPKVLAGKRVLITAGPTYEAIDPVRGITNLSSGKMGYAIARAAQEAGADVTLISGPTALDAPWRVARTSVRTAMQMQAAVDAALGPNGDGMDVFIGVAAVADWRVANANGHKMKKEDGHPKLEFEHNPDILAGIAALAKVNGRPYCVGFAAESQDLLAHCAAKRVRKGVPLLVGNIGHETFGSDDNALVLFDDAGTTNLPAQGRANKRELAQLLVVEIAERLRAQ